MTSQKNVTKWIDSLLASPPDSLQGSSSLAVKVYKENTKTRRSLSPSREGRLRHQQQAPARRAHCSNLAGNHSNSPLDPDFVCGQTSLEQTLAALANVGSYSTRCTGLWASLRFSGLPQGLVMKGDVGHMLGKRPASPASFKLGNTSLAGEALRSIVTPWASPKVICICRKGRGVATNQGYLPWGLLPRTLLLRDLDYAASRAELLQKAINYQALQSQTS